MAYSIHEFASYVATAWAPYSCELSSVRVSAVHVQGLQWLTRDASLSVNGAQAIEEKSIEANPYPDKLD
jgi:hypothetical protein